MTAKDWAATCAELVLFNAHPTMNMQAIVERAVREALAKAAEVAEKTDGDEYSIAANIRALGATK
jgi:preprotein translocase subunit Sss1